MYEIFMCEYINITYDVVMSQARRDS